jgi:hypothetical protein
MGCRECVVFLNDGYRRGRRLKAHSTSDLALTSRKITGLALLMNKNKIDSTRFSRQLPLLTAVPLNDWARSSNEQDQDKSTRFNVQLSFLTAVSLKLRVLQECDETEQCFSTKHDEDSSKH